METTHTIFLTVILVSVPTYIVADDRDGCPTNLPRDQYLKVHGGKCYQFAVHRHLPWPKAEGDCRTRGGHLVKVENMAEEEFIMGNLRSYSFRGQGVWIGLTRPRDGTSFTWVTGEPIQFHYWAPGQPGSGSSRRRRLLIGNLQLPTGLPSLHLPKVFHEDCVLLKYTDSGHWHDYPCEQLDFLGLVPENFPYICEYPLIDNTPELVGDVGFGSVVVERVFGVGVVNVECGALVEWTISSVLLTDVVAVKYGVPEDLTISVVLVIGVVTLELVITFLAKINQTDKY